jgi:hypothetical protein
MPACWFLTFPWLLRLRLYLRLEKADRFNQPDNIFRSAYAPGAGFKGRRKEPLRAQMQPSRLAWCLSCGLGDRIYDAFATVGS